MTQLDRNRMKQLYIIIVCYLLSYTSSTIAEDDFHSNNTQLLWDSLLRGELSDINTDAIHSSEAVSVVVDAATNITTAYDEDITLIGDFEVSDNDNMTTSVELVDYDINIECDTHHQFNGTFCEPVSDKAESLNAIISDIFNATSGSGNATQPVIAGSRKDSASSELLKIDQFSEMNVGNGINDKILQRRDNDNVEVVLAKDLKEFVPPIRAVDGNGEKRKIVRKLGGSKQRQPGQTSLVIVFDGTGSMEHCLVQLRTGARLIVEKFANQDDNPIYNYIFVPFRDPRKYNIFVNNFRRCLLFI